MTYIDLVDSGVRLALEKPVDCSFRAMVPWSCDTWRIFASRNEHTWCYAQALGVVDVGSLSVELSWRIKVRSGRPSYRASQGQNHGVRRGCRDSGKSGNRPEDRGFTSEGNRS